MVAGKRYYGLQTDIWSCGIILYAMICGYLPFEDPNTSVLYKKIMQGEFKLPVFLTERSKFMLKGILNKEPAERFTIQQIREHGFVSQNEVEEIVPGIVVGVDEIPVDPKIIKSLEQYNFDLDQAQDMVRNNKHNYITATYYLTQQKLRRTADLATGADAKQMKKFTEQSKSDNFKLIQTKIKSPKNDHKKLTLGQQDGGGGAQNENRPTIEQARTAQKAREDKKIPNILQFESDQNSLVQRRRIGKTDHGPAAPTVDNANNLIKLLNPAIAERKKTKSEHINTKLMQIINNKESLNQSINNGSANNNAPRQVPPSRQRLRPNIKSTVQADDSFVRSYKQATDITIKTRDVSPNTYEKVRIADISYLNDSYEKQK